MLSESTQNFKLTTDKIGPQSLLNKNYDYDIKIENRIDFRIKGCWKNILIFTDGPTDQNGHTGFGSSA